jgi:putative transposase
MAVDERADRWAAQQARNLVMSLDQRADTLRFLLRDRDSKFNAAFDAVFTAVGLEILRTPPQAPRANAIAERWVGTVRRECTDRILITGERHLHVVLDEYVRHYNAHRPHRGIGLETPVPATPAPLIGLRVGGSVERVDVLGGLIHEYHRAASPTHWCGTRVGVMNCLYGT